MCTDPLYGVTLPHPRGVILISYRDQDGETVPVHSTCFNSTFHAYTRKFENQPSDCIEKRITDDISPVALASDIPGEDAATKVASYPGVDPRAAVRPRTPDLPVTVQNISACQNTWRGLPSSASGLTSGQVRYAFLTRTG